MLRLKSSHFLQATLQSLFLKTVDINITQFYSIFRNSLRNFTKFTGKHLCQRLFFSTESLVQLFSCKFYESSNNNFFTENLLTTASAYSRFSCVNSAFPGFVITGIFSDKSKSNVNN